MSKPSRSPARSRRLVGAAALLSVALTACNQASEPSGTSPAGSAGESPSGTPSTSASPEPSPDRSPSKAPAGPTLAVRVTGDEVAPVAHEVDLAVGETLSIEVRADRAGELHLHSEPEQLLTFGDGTERFTVTLRSPGSVDLEEHDSGTLVARLLVR